MVQGAVDMDRLFGLALSTLSPRASLSSISHRSEFALGNTANSSADTRRADASLSTRERTIVLLMGNGLTNKMIARELSIAPETVKSHAKRIFWKLMVQTRAQAVYRASELGLI